MIGLFFLGTGLTIVGFYIAYRIGSKDELEEDTKRFDSELEEIEKKLEGL